MKKISAVPTMCECGYWHAASRDALHRSVHDQYLYGAPAKPLKDDEVVAEADGVQIILVRPTALAAQRKRVEKIGYVANREMHYDTGVYHATEREYHRDSDVHALLALREGRVIAMVLLGRRKSIYKGFWNDTEPPSPLPAQRVETEGNRWTVCFVWVLPKFRRSGLARKLVEEASRFCGVPVQELCWYWPFSDAGAQLAHRLCPKDIWLAQ
jgi:ribosomal protein S18 acetylase RimI-like enzyme